MSKYHKLVGTKLRELRERYLISIKEFCDYASCTPEELQAYECGLELLPMNIAKEISEWYMEPLTGIFPTIKECDVRWIINKKVVGRSSMTNYTTNSINNVAERKLM